MATLKKNQLPAADALAANFNTTLADLAESQNLADEARKMVEAISQSDLDHPTAIYPRLEAICALLEKSVSLNASSSELLQNTQWVCVVPEKETLSDCATDLDLKTDALKVIFEQWGRHLNNPCKNNSTDHILFECAERYLAEIDGITRVMYKAAGLREREGK
jgi:hypothetical protein